MQISAMTRTSKIITLDVKALGSMQVFARTRTSKIITLDVKSRCVFPVPSIAIGMNCLSSGGCIRMRGRRSM